MTDFVTELIKYVRSGQASFLVNSREEMRVIEDVRQAGWRLAKEMIEVDVVLSPDFEDAYRYAVGQVSPGPRRKNVRTADLVAAFDALSKMRPADNTEDEKIIHYQKCLAAVLDKAGYMTITWDMVSGFSGSEKCSNTCVDDFRAAISSIIDKTSDMPSRCLIVMKDCHGHLNSENPVYRRALRNACEDNRTVNGDLSRHMIFLQPYVKPHEDIRHCLVRIDFPLPRDKEIDSEISNTQQGILDVTKRDCPADLRLELVRSLRGLDTANIVKTLAYCVVDFKGFAPEVEGPSGGKRRLIPTVRGMRSKQLSTGQGLRIIDPDDPELTMLGSLGGYENVRALAERIVYCRTKEAVDLQLRAPNGMALAGAPGTGKTVCAKMFAHWVGLPICIVNLGTLKEGIVGSSERNTAMALETIWALGDCVVLFDEWDKQAGGIVGSNTDGNTSSGMLSLILDFASDPRRTAFLVFTMNRLHGPIESLRAGRISRFFYTPLPDAVDREEIMMLKLTEAGAEIPKNLKEIAADAVTGGLSGSELTEMVHEAIALSAIRNHTKSPTVKHLHEAREVVTPVTKLNKEEIAAMEDFKGIAISVSKEKKKASDVSQLVNRRQIRIDPSNN